LALHESDLAGCGGLPFLTKTLTAISGEQTQETFEVTTEAGFIKYYNPEKGFGFIKPDSASSPDVFFHKSCAEPGTPLELNVRVRFAAGLGDNGRLRALSVVGE
jgi:cold shock CspA family protein